MTKWLMAGTSLMMLAGCGGSPAAVGENSADSIRTTAVGNVVAAVPSSTPTPTPVSTVNEMVGTDATAQGDINPMADNLTSAQ